MSKYFILIAMFILVIACTPKGPEQEKPTFWCIHPFAYGGQPFQLPANVYFSRNGRAEFQIPSGESIELIGLTCIRVTPAKGAK